MLAIELVELCHPSIYISRRVYLFDISNDSEFPIELLNYFNNKNKTMA